LSAVVKPAAALKQGAAEKSAAGKGAAPDKKVRVLLAEDQTMLRGALAALLELEADIHVVGQAANARRSG